jgi:glycerol kinase
MAANRTFVQALADASQRSIEVSPELEATTRGAGFLAGLALGTWSSDKDVMGTWKPARTVEPTASFDRERWQEACRRAAAWIPELSSLDF